MIFYSKDIFIIAGNIFSSCWVTYERQTSRLMCCIYESEKGEHIEAIFIYLS
jgi:hypothetical protein